MLFLNDTPELSPIDFEIYKYIASHMEQVSYMRIRELATCTQASTASILRFCKKFGCEGFSEFKIKLRWYQENLEKQQTVRTVDESAFINFIHRLKEERFQEDLQKAVQLLAEKEMVFFIGGGTSNSIASYGAFYFASIFPVVAHLDLSGNHSLNSLSTASAEKMALIVLSVDGESLDVINYLNHFVAQQRAIISITNSANSTIASLSDVNLAYYITTARKGKADIATQVPALYTIEYLAKEVQKSKNKKA
ncbi:hypothetical protein DOK78_000136 [Enterococcus sp. DIV2402]|uniref:RpiR family transcriptional regulator n=1 Tax=Candidatus Enterococcus lowellii TaxID=2230877 RepID=A0ABZ2SMF5_9ENTE|nr:MurR/RpiR family transcriptional regulator [Enterococcus sp. DIV2402]MBO0463163.1 MurR/RpiR family transcriptional regulator [Enterococcus sp. DIV2402]